MNTYKIHVEKADSIYDEWGYCATFDGYDGAPDSDDVAGYGNTEIEAMYDLLERSL